MLRKGSSIGFLALLLVFVVAFTSGCSRYVMEDDGMEHNKQVFMETFAECGINEEQAEEAAFILRTIRIGTIVEITASKETLYDHFFETYFTDDTGTEYYMGYCESGYISGIRLKDAFELDYMYTIETGLDFFAWLADWKAGIPGTPEKYPGNYLGYVPRSINGNRL